MTENQKETPEGTEVSKLLEDIKKKRENGEMTENQARALLGLDPSGDPYADTLFISLKKCNSVV